MSHESFLEHAPSVIRRAKSVWSDFIDFVASENVLQVAVGLIIANGFTKVVQSLVSDILLPPIALLPFIDRNFEEKFVVLRKGPHATPGHGYNTLEQAAADGAVVLAYGEFITNVANFFALGVFLFLIARIYAMFTHETIIKHTVKCAYCRKYIPQKAKRCFNCTSWLDGREERETSALQ
ncbi:gated mechanosensitive channel [Lentinula guzmanii]|uniref:Gated mechanosensitive channel n=3 Tax=Lentinula TaxID=5352 RepID=A0AA38JNI1_9AGAR|nr:gated mechanosensitive channel [Lentinula guzmanii]KAJ3744269.1 gated mechanosensitive channel [Lentinula detonsa]KAJ3780804.1 gated mechanosensitive channel [Lentinula aff. detonsa]KAJ3792731.1 gated mechanosensitive channel [Lentinula aff. detonsa]KAJ3979597.1 gated mechanosensitive channel [Lentinula detonsa]